MGTWLGGRHGRAIGLVVLNALASVPACLWAGGKKDVAAMMRTGADEGPRIVARDAASLTAFAIFSATIAGVAVQSARPTNPGVFELLCVVDGLIYAGRLVALHHRRRPGL